MYGPLVPPNGRLTKEVLVQALPIIESLLADRAGEVVISAPKFELGTRIFLEHNQGLQGKDEKPFLLSDPHHGHLGLLKKL